MKKLWLLSLVFCISLLLFGCQELPSVEELLSKISINESLLYQAEANVSVTHQNGDRIDTKVIQYTSFQEQKTIYYIDRIIKTSTHTKQSNSIYEEASGHYIFQSYYDYDETLEDYKFSHSLYDYVSIERLDQVPVVLEPTLPLFNPDFQDIDFALLDVVIKRSGRGYSIQIEAEYQTLVEIDPELRFLYLDADFKLRYDIKVDKNYVITEIHLYAVDSTIFISSTLNQYSFKISFVDSTYAFPSEVEKSQHRSLAGYPDNT
jgi:hypothetical protein